MVDAWKGGLESVSEGPHMHRPDSQGCGQFLVVWAVITLLDGQSLFEKRLSLGECILNVFIAQPGGM